MKEIKALRPDLLYRLEVLLGKPYPTQNLGTNYAELHKSGVSTGGGLASTFLDYYTKLARV